MSWFSSSNSSSESSSNLHPVQSRFNQEALFGPLQTQDLEWICAGGFVTETQTFYATTKEGGLVMCQVIHSAVGLWYPSIQFTFRYVSADRTKHVWKSVAVTNFTPGSGNPALDKRSSKSDQFTITVDPKSPNKYTIVGKYDDQVQISLTYEKLAEGWKVGAGPRGGMTYFGSLKAPKAGKENDATPDVTSGADGYCVHRFWPRCAVGGVISLGDQVVEMDGSRGVFVHAIQGMRPNTLAAKWNFANFQSPAEDGVSLIMMEFETTPAYGSKKINIGSIVVDDKLVAVTAGGAGVEGKSVAQHLNSVKDAETDYAAPGAILYTWEGASIPATAGGVHKAQLKLDLLEAGGEAEYKTKGLVEKVDVLGQIPYLVKKFVNYAAGTKPFIYTWLNPATASVTTAGGETKQVSGHIFNEATYIS